MCECPLVISSDRFPCHSNLVGMVKNYLVINHNCDIKADDIIKSAHENDAIYDAENEEEITEYFFILFGAPGAIPHAYTEKELRGYFSTTYYDEEQFKCRTCGDTGYDKDGKICPECMTRER